MAGFFTRLWSSCAKSSRASLALRVFPDLTREELMELALADAYVNILDDFLDLECLEDARGPGARAVYVRTILLAEALLKSQESKRYLGVMIGRVFDAEYSSKGAISGAVERDPLGWLEKLYVEDAHDAWLFFAYPASRRLPGGEAEALTRAGVLFRALWLVLDHLEDLEEDRKNNTTTGVRYLVDMHGEPRLVAALASRLDLMLHESLAGMGESVYKRNLLAEYDALRAALVGEMKRHGIPWPEGAASL